MIGPYLRQHLFHFVVQLYDDFTVASVLGDTETPENIIVRKTLNRRQKSSARV